MVATKWRLTEITNEHINLRYPATSVLIPGPGKWSGAATLTPLQLPDRWLWCWRTFSPVLLLRIVILQFFSPFPLVCSCSSLAHREFPPSHFSHRLGLIWIDRRNQLPWQMTREKHCLSEWVNERGCEAIISGWLFYGTNYPTTHPVTFESPESVHCVNLMWQIKRRKLPW